jgi:L-cysteine desulfidase
LLGYKLASSGKVVQGGDGIILDDIDSTVENYGKLAHDGMYETDQKILELMIS